MLLSLDLIWAKARFASARKSLAAKLATRKRPRFEKHIFKGHEMHLAVVHFKISEEKTMGLMQVTHQPGWEGHYFVSMDDLPLRLRLIVFDDQSVQLKTLNYKTLDCWFCFPPWGGWYDYNVMGVVPY